MKRCIFCGKSEDEFDSKNMWSDEHIIPECLGNSTLKINNVCKHCNSSLGTYVDNHFVNHHFIKSKRQFLRLRSQNGNIPNAFQEGVTADGERIRMSADFVPSVVPSVKQEGNKLITHANSVAEARKILSTKLRRLHMPLEKIEEYISKIDESCFQSFQPEIRYDILLDINRFLLEALKIGYEYAVYKFGDRYLDDPTAANIRARLNLAISGKLQSSCEKPPEASYAPEYLMSSLGKSSFIGAHYISIASTIHNELIAHVVLFFSPFAALREYEDEIASEGREHTKTQRIELSEERKEHLGATLMQLHKGSFVTVRYFTDGYYEDISRKVESVDGVYKELKMSTGMKNDIGKELPTIIPFEDILEVVTK